MVNSVIPAASITVRKGEGDQCHNMRIFSAPNVDKNRTKDNIVFVNEPIGEAYRKCFDSGIREYNVGKKPSRKKWADMEHPADGYLSKLEKDIAECTDSKKRKKLPKPFYEVIVQIGNMEDFGILTHKERAQIAKEVLVKYMDEFQKNNPRLYVFCAVLHMDEGNGKINGGTPHLHIDYFPVAYSLKQGLPVRNSLTQALAQQGVVSGNNPKDNNNSTWQVQQIDLLKKICDEHGIRTKVIGAEKRAYLTPDEYRALMAINEQKLCRAREETDKSIKHSAFGMALVDVEKLKEERAVADVLQEQYHNSLQNLNNKSEELQNHYHDAEVDLRAEADKELQALKDAREKAENADRQRQGEALIAQAEQMMEEAKSIEKTAYKEAKELVRKDTERKVKEAEARGRQLGKMDMQDKIANLQSRAIKAENSLVDALHVREKYKEEIALLQAELDAERERAQKEAERYVNLISTVKENFAMVSKSAKVRVDCQKYFEGTELYDVVKWRYSDGRERKPNKLSLQHTL